MKKLLFFFALAALVAGCTQKGNSGSDENAADSLSSDSAAVTYFYDNLVNAEARAAVDSSYAKSEEYTMVHEAFDKQMDKMADNMTEGQSLLMQLHYAINCLEEHGRHFASNVEEMRDPVNQQRMRIYAQKVKDLRSQLEKLELTPDDKQMLDSLKKKIRF